MGLFPKINQCLTQQWSQSVFAIAYAQEDVLRYTTSTFECLYTGEQYSSFSGKRIKKIELLLGRHTNSRSQGKVAPPIVRNILDVTQFCSNMDSRSWLTLLGIALSPLSTTSTSRSELLLHMYQHSTTAFLPR